MKMNDLGSRKKETFKFNGRLESSRFIKNRSIFQIGTNKKITFLSNL
jgi:hypothetical protein